MAQQWQRRRNLFAFRVEEDGILDGAAGKGGFIQADDEQMGSGAVAGAGQGSDVERPPARRGGLATVLGEQVVQPLRQIR